MNKFIEYIMAWPDHDLLYQYYYHISGCFKKPLAQHDRVISELINELEYRNLSYNTYDELKLGIDND